MLIHCIAEIVSCRNFFFIEFPCLVVMLGGDIRSCRADQLNFGIFCVDCLFECLISTKEVNLFRLPLLIADADHRQPEGLWMSHFCTDTSPGAVCRTVCKLDQVNRILQKLLKLRLVHFHQLIGLELTRQTDIQNRQRLCTDQLTQQKIFIKTDAEGLVVMGILRVPSVFLARQMHCPAIEIRAAIFDVADALFPAVAVFQCISFDNTSTRKTQKTGMQAF